jgi:hypothetical protein
MHHGGNLESIVICPGRERGGVEPAGIVWIHKLGNID